MISKWHQINKGSTLQHEQGIQNSCGDSTHEAKIRLPLTWHKLKITTAVFFVDVEY